METDLLATKLFIPELQSNLVNRKRLFNKLNAGLDKKLTLVSAPAGFGKSTLISSWIKTPIKKQIGFLLMLKIMIPPDSSLISLNWSRKMVIRRKPG